MSRKRRYTDIIGSMRLGKRAVSFALVIVMLTGCGFHKSAIATETASDYSVDFKELKKENSDIFGWLYIPDTAIDYPLLQSSDGDDYYYATHDASKKESGKGAIYIEAANLNDMCDFNEVIHGASPADGTMFAELENFLDRTYFENHEYAHIYMDGNALTYLIIAAYTRDDGNLLQQYDFTYASGCRQFIDEIYSGGDMNKQIRSGCEEGLSPDLFLITLTAPSTHMPGKQTVVIGCLMGDAAGIINREPFDEYEEY